MPKTISASVGLRGHNLEDDVVTIQTLLNKVPPSQGGPDPVLAVDGICGPKTRGAIQRFQLDHFGWSGADGRVDPGQQTLAKLNEFDPDPLPPPPIIPPTPEPLSSDFVIVPSFQGDVFTPPITPTQFTYLILDVTNNRERVYQLQFGAGGAPAAGPFQGFFSRFTPRKPTTVSGFEGIGGYITSETINPGLHSGTSIRSTLNLFPPEGGSGISIPMKTHLFEKSKNPDAGGMTTGITGDFKIVR
jgi:peptidoglycan hydrolase-like protein with peptidoglycan-binding domain